MLFDNASSAEDNLNLMRVSYEWKNYGETESNANKIIALDQNNHEAWLYKGKAVGRQINPDYNRFSETVDCFVAAVANAPEKEIETVKEQIRQELKQLALELTQMRCDLFARFTDADETEELFDDIFMLRDTLANSASALGIDTSDIISSVVSLLNDQAEDVFNSKKKAYKSTKHPNKEDAGQLAMAGACCCLVLDTIIQELAPNDDHDNVLRYQTIAGINTFIMALRYYYPTTQAELKFASRELWIKLNQKVVDCYSKIKELDPAGLIKQAQIAEAEETERQRKEG